MVFEVNNDGIEILQPGIIKIVPGVFGMILEKIKNGKYYYERKTNSIYKLDKFDAHEFSVGGNNIFYLAGQRYIKVKVI